MTAAAMADDRFWSIVDRNSQSDNDPYARLDALQETLRALSLDDLIAFEVAFRRFLNKAYTWDLWGAAYVIHGGCSDDGFEYFRRWLVSRGRNTYEAALADPESLADIALEPMGPEGFWEFEEFYYVAHDVFEGKDGDGDIGDYSEPEAGLLEGSEPSGNPFEEDEGHLANRYPKLWQRFGHAPLG